MTLRILGDTIEIDGQAAATLLPNLRLSQRDQLTEAFDSIGEDEAYIAELESRVAQLETRIAQREARIAQLEERLKEPAR